jgi:hypothetical protein
MVVPDVGNPDVDGAHLVRRLLDSADVELGRLDRRDVDRTDLVGPDLVGAHLERRLLGVPNLAVN